MQGKYLEGHGELIMCFWQVLNPLRATLQDALKLTWLQNSLFKFILLGGH